MAKYSSKITGLVYEPNTKGDLPLWCEMMDSGRTHLLLKKIDALDIKDSGLREFLRESAHRFTRFRYDLIADFYSRCEDEEIKALFRELALVVVDFDQFIENGCAKFDGELRKYIEDASAKNSENGEK